MSYMALYRKFRPQTFDRVKGQEHVVRTLKNQIINGRVGHAYLFTGTRGTGKTSVAKLFARAINCLSPKDGEPCNECDVCKACENDSFADIVEVDAASNTGVDDIRRIIEEIQYTPVKGKYKVYIIDEAHMLSGSAFNAFLKTLEEPPAYAVFILATTEPHKLPVTILSRCQRYDFHRIDNKTIAENLKEITDAEGVEADDKALSYVAAAGDGSMRDAVSLLDKCIAFSLGERLTFDGVLEALGEAETEIFSELLRAVHNGDAAKGLAVIEQTAKEGRDISRFVSDFIWYLRNALILSAGGSDDPEMLGISADNMTRLKEDALSVPAETLMRYIRVMSELLDSIRFSSSKRVLLEVAVIKLAKPQTETDTESLADRVRQLERRGAGGLPQDQEKTSAQGEAAASSPEPTSLKIEETAASSPEPTSAEINTSPEAPVAAEGDGFVSAEPGKKSADVIDCWQDIISVIDSILVKTALRHAQPRKTENGLDILARSGMDKSHLENGLPDIKRAVSLVMGTELEVRVLLGEKKNTEERVDESEIDALLETINFKIGTEEY